MKFVTLRCLFEFIKFIACLVGVVIFGHSSGMKQGVLHLVSDFLFI